MGVEISSNLGCRHESKRYEPTGGVDSQLLMDFNVDTPATHTRSLHLSQREEAWITPLNLVQYFEHFRSFDRVESLTLSYFSCRAFSRTTLQLFFRNLIPTVRKLRLRHPIGCPTSLLTGCIEGFSRAENCIENAMKITNSITKFYILKSVIKVKVFWES